MVLNGHRWQLAAVAVLCWSYVAVPVRAADDAANSFLDIETEDIFGFTSGTDIGEEGEKEFSIGTTARIGKANGRYLTTQTEFEFEHTPTQFYQFELAALVDSQNISNVTGFEDHDRLVFGGLSGEFRYLLVGRGPGSPVGVTVSVEPEWSRFSDNSGDRENSFELETKIAADTELVPNRLYFAVNGTYEPEWTRTAAGDMERESTLGVSAALAFRPIAPLLVGAEVEYFRKYDGIGFDTFTGDAVYIGPTLYAKLAREVSLSAAWSTQVGGHAVGDPDALNLAQFSRRRAKLKLSVEF